MNEYELPYGLYRTNQERFPLSEFNITATLTGISENGRKFLKDFPNSEVAQSVESQVGKIIELSHKKNDTYYGKIAGKEISFNSLHTVSFNSKDHKNIDITEFMKAVKTADLSHEFSQVLNTLAFGYLQHHVNDFAILSKVLKEFLKENPESFLLMDSSREIGSTLEYHYLSLDEEQLSSFKKISEKYVVANTGESKVIEDYLVDLEKFREGANLKVQKNKAKLSR